MNEQQLHKMIRTHRLALSKKRLYRHYSASGVSAIVSTFFLYLVLKGYWPGGVEGTVYLPLCFSVAALAFLLYVNQYRALRLKEVSTGLSGEQNQRMVRATLEKLGWPVSVDEQGFIEAYTPASFPKDLRTWGAEMVSIVITDDRVLVNSICNLEHYPAQAAFSLGKNGQNVRKFRETLELLAVSRLGQAPAFSMADA